jgi:hypothetical protein
MKIPDLKELPNATHGAEWARLIQCDPGTIARAYAAGHLERAKAAGRRALYTKKAILRWLGLSDQ